MEGSLKQNVDCLILGYPGEDNKLLSFKQQLYHHGITTSLNFTTMFYPRVIMETSLLKNKLESNGFTTKHIVSIVNNWHIMNDFLPRFIVIAFRYFESSSQIVKTVKMVRQLLQGAQIIVGGGFFYQAFHKLSPFEASYYLKLLQADFYIDLFDCSDTVIQIMQQAEHPSHMQDIPFIYFRSGDDYIKSNQNNHYSPQRDAKAVNYGHFLHSLPSVAAMRTSVSCPYNCSFCAVKNKDDRFQKLPLSVIRQDVIDLMNTPQVSIINFTDETLNLPVNTFKTFLQMLIDTGRPPFWFSFVRADQIDEETAVLMKKSGCRAVMIGFESGSDQLLSTMNKQTTVQKLLKAHQIIKQQNILTIAYFIIGFPGETRGTIEETFRFIQAIQPDFYQVNVWSCEVNSDIYLARQNYHLVLNGKNWSHDTMDTQQAHAAVTYIRRHVKGPAEIHSFDITFALQLLQHGVPLATVKKLYKTIDIS